VYSYSFFAFVDCSPLRTREKGIVALLCRVGLSLDPFWSATQGFPAQPLGLEAHLRVLAETRDS